MIRDRKLNRLKDSDYSEEGYYFVTVCAKDRVEMLGEVKGGKMILNEYGDMVNGYWAEIPRHYKNVDLDEFVIMPNHVHGIIIIASASVGTEQCSVPTNMNTNTNTKRVSISQIIKSFKDVTTKQMRSRYGVHFSWQRSFHDHIIRDEMDLNRVREYIGNNPLQWDEDVENEKRILQNL